MIKLPYNQLESLANNQLCAEHGTPVGVAWHAKEDCWTLRCDEGSHDDISPDYPSESKLASLVCRGHYPDALARKLSLTELYKSGEEVPLPIVNNIKKREVKKAMNDPTKALSKSLGFTPAVDLGSGEVLPLELINKLIDYAIFCGLEVGLGHVVLMYSKPYITLDGYLYHANREKIPYKLSSRPLNDEERKTYRIGEEDHAWLAEIEEIYPKGYVTGLGIVTKVEMEAKSKRDTTKLASPVVAAHPWQLAQKRAEWQALRRAFPIGETEEVNHGKG